MIALLAACYTFDDVPLAEGPHCAPDMLAYVVEVLDGDTVRVYAYGNQEELGGSEGTDTGEVNSSSADEPSGDDAYVLDVRMLGVDAPEIAHDSTEVADCYGDEAANFTSDLLLDQWVILSFDRTCTDAYDRALAYVILGDVYDDIDECEEVDEEEVCEPDSSDAAVLVNDIVIRYGYARVYEEFDDIRLADLLYSAQDAAQKGNQGLWAECE